MKKFYFMLCVLFLFQTAAAEVLTPEPDDFTRLTPSADTFVYGAEAGQNTSYGAAETIICKRNNTSNDYVRQALIKFDLSSIPADAEIIGAKIWVYATYKQNTTEPVSVYAVADDTWTEDTVWTNRPTAGGLGDKLTTQSISALNTYVGFDVTNYIRSELTARMTSVLIYPDSHSGELRFYSKENAANHPYLEVTFQTPRADILSANFYKRTEDGRESISTLQGGTIDLDALVENNTQSDTKITLIAVLRKGMLLEDIAVGATAQPVTAGAAAQLSVSLDVPDPREREILFFLIDDIEGWARPLHRIQRVFSSEGIR